METEKIKKQAIIKKRPLPKKLVEKIDSIFSRGFRRQRSLGFCFNVIEASERQGRAYVSIPSRRLISQFGTSYSRFVKKLKEEGVIETMLNERGTETYSDWHSQCKQYAISPEYLEGEPVEAEVSISTRFWHTPEEKYVIKMLASIEKLGDDAEKAAEAAKERARKITEADSSLRFAQKIKDEQDDFIYDTVEGAKYLYEGRKTVCNIGGKLVSVSNPEEYADKKGKAAYADELKKVALIEKNDLDAEITHSNGRMSHSLTETRRETFAMYAKKNGLACVDASCSQIAILASMIQNAEPSFTEAARNGTFYDVLSKELGISRDECKVMTLQTLFSKKGQCAAQKSAFRTLWPKAHAEAVKIGRSSELALMLQKKESEIVIGKVLKHFIGEDRLCIPVHDAVCVRREDVAEALRVMEESYAAAGVRCSFKTRVF